MFDEQSLELMLRTLAVCLVLTGIHGYLGLHVLQRKVIFVDLAMAQIAALGATYALFLGYEQNAHPTVVYLFSLGFTLAGAAVFSITRMRHEKIPQEALIGIVYATASALAILILAKSTTAGEHIKGMLIGNLLAVSRGEIVKMAIIYTIIGAFHWILRDKFFAITMNPEKAYESGINVRLWDFLFYATFGVVITSSVAVAGVLLVFSFLVVPAAIAVMFAETIGRRLALAWVAGTVVSVGGVWFSFFEGDLHPGPVVVASFAVALVLSGVVRYIALAPARGRALMKVGTGAALVGVLVGGSLLLRSRPEVHTHEAHGNEFEKMLEDLRSDEETRQLHGINSFREHPDPHAMPDLLALLKRTTCDRVIRDIALVLRHSKDPAALPVLKETLRRDLDPALRYVVAEAILELKDPAGLGVLIDIFSDRSAPRLTRDRALKAFDRLTGKTYGYTLDGDPLKLERIRAWYKQHGGNIRWRESTGRFE